MSRRVYFWNHPYPSNHCVMDKFFYFLSWISFRSTKSCILSELRVRLELEGKGVFIHYMPVKSVHLIVHHGINCFLQDFHRNEMARWINQDASILKNWFVFNFNRKCNHVAVFMFFVADDGLKKSFKSTYESNIMLSMDWSAFPCDIESIWFLFWGESTS